MYWQPPRRNWPGVPMAILGGIAAAVLARYLAPDWRSSFASNPTQFIKMAAELLSSRLGVPGRVAMELVLRFLQESGFDDKVAAWQGGQPSPTAPRSVTYGEVDRLRSTLEASLVGQADAIRTIVSAVEGLVAGTRLNPKAPLSFVMVGPTGTGKTRSIEILAEVLGRELFTIDLPNYKQKEQIWELLGSPQGYHGGEGKLTRHIRMHPTSVVLLDEWEKGHPEMLDFALRMLDRGVVKDVRTGQPVEFSRTIVAFTSNLLRELDRAGANDQNTLRNRLLATQYVRPEMLGRLEYVIPFYGLTRRDLEIITEKALRTYLLRVFANRKWAPALTIEPSAIALLCERQDDAYGARNVTDSIRVLVTESLQAALRQQATRVPVSVRVRAADSRVDIAFS